MELVKRFLLGCAGFLFMYLMCSFYNVTFNISKWSGESRFFTVLFGGIFFITLVAPPNFFLNNIDDYSSAEHNKIKNNL